MTIQQPPASPAERNRYVTIKKRVSPVQHIGLYVLVGLLLVVAVPHAIAVLIMGWAPAMLNVHLAASVIVYLAAWRAEIQWHRAQKNPRRKQHKRDRSKADNAAAWEDLKRRFDATE